MKTRTGKWILKERKCIDGYPYFSGSLWTHRQSSAKRFDNGLLALKSLAAWNKNNSEPIDARAVPLVRHVRIAAVDADIVREAMIRAVNIVIDRADLSSRSTWREDCLDVISDIRSGVIK